MAYVYPFAAHTFRHRSFRINFRIKITLLLWSTFRAARVSCHATSMVSDEYLHSHLNLTLKTSSLPTIRTSPFSGTITAVCPCVSLSLEYIGTGGCVCRAQSKSFSIYLRPFTSLRNDFADQQNRHNQRTAHLCIRPHYLYIHNFIPVATHARRLALYLTFAIKNPHSKIQWATNK